MTRKYSQISLLELNIVWNISNVYDNERFFEAKKKTVASLIAHD